MSSELPPVIANAMIDFINIASKERLVVWAEESQFALQAFQASEHLQKCAPHTVQNAIINVAAVGLTLNPSAGYAYLVPEYNKQTRVVECQLRISFKGLIKLATDTGSIKWVKAEIVRKADNFTYKGACYHPHHEMDPFCDRGDPVGVYCIAKTGEDDILVDVMSWDEVMKIKSCAKTPVVWEQWPEEMAKKALIKRAQKQWPKTKSERLHQAVHILNEQEGNDDIVQKIAERIHDAIARDDYDYVRETWSELTKEEESQLWVAETKGGHFSQSDKRFIRAALSNNRIDQ